MMDFYGDTVRWFIGIVVDNNDCLLYTSDAADE